MGGTQFAAAFPPLLPSGAAVSNFASIDSAVEAQLSAQLETLKTLCAQPSIAAQNVGMRRCADLVAELLSARGFEVSILPTKGQPVVYAERDGTSDRTLLFYNHYDVQPPEPFELWQSPPFEPVVRDGKLFARGVSDDKGHIVCRLAALDAILSEVDELPCRIKFLIEGEEEMGSPNLPEFVAGNKELLAADACIWEFGGVDYQGRSVQSAGLRGICYVELVARTATLDSHSGLGGGIFPNAAWRLTWALGTLKAQNERIQISGFYDKVIPPTARDLELLGLLPEVADSYKQDYGLKGFIKGLSGGLELHREEVFTPTCTICGLTSGYQGPGTKTVLPAEARAKVDFRLVPDQDPHEIFDLLKTHLARQGFDDIEVQWLGGEPPGRTDPDDPFLQMVVESARPVYGKPQIIEPIAGGSGPVHAFIQHLGVPVATAGVSYPGAQVHAPNENVVIDNFVNGVKHTARIVMTFAEA
jgi:acetylornithine deacetylase/succinyl-diaminopimelate desuccinylase-like protein